MVGVRDIGPDVAAATLARLDAGAEGEAMVTERDLATHGSRGSHPSEPRRTRCNAPVRIRRRTSRVAVTNRLDPAGIDETIARAASSRPMPVPDPDPAPLAGGASADSDLGWVTHHRRGDPTARAEGAHAVIDAGWHGASPSAAPTRSRPSG